MTLAFLFLTYDNFINNDIFLKFLNKQNIYIHPKYKNKIDDKLKLYIIDNIIDTKWCDISIINATFNLLQKAYDNKENKYFFLLSSDSYPLYNFEDFEDKFNKIHNNKSIFNFKRTLLFKQTKYYITSQWCILNRNDVNILLSVFDKYKHLFKIKIKEGCPDEIIILSLLMWNNKNYKYTNCQFMYDKWLKYTIQKSPLYFNKYLKQDNEYINKKNCLFIRKITKNFTLDIYKTKKKLYIIFIGEKTNQDIKFNDEFDIIILLGISIDLLKQSIIDRSIYIINIIWRFFYETILNLCNENFIKNWELVIFTSEVFNINNYNSIEKIKKNLPYNSFKFKSKYLINENKFYYITDNNNQLAFCIKN
jgi:hypothetical protein